MTSFTQLSSRKSPPRNSSLTENDAQTDKGSVYLSNDAIDAAVDVAIGLGKPLLVAGEPGSGKTELGFAVARRMEIKTLYFFSVKSSSEAGDLFYTYDAISRFRDAQLAQIRATAAEKIGAIYQEPDVGNYIKYRALGRAILDAHGRKAETEGLLRGTSAPDLSNCPRRSVVIIDEIDKAPRDFTNDLLREIEDISFRVPELQNTGGQSDSTPSGDKIPPGMKPIIIITSNEESQLPDAFLRRCVFLAIEFPEKDVLRQILDMHLGVPGVGEGTLASADRDILLTVFARMREQNMQKNPGIAELVDAGRILAARPSGTAAKDWLPRLAPALVKLKADLSAFQTAVATKLT
jgi:MoxR-like ATPase